MVDRAVLKTIIAEAGGDPSAMTAVAAVINNRAQKTGKTPLQVVKQRGQFEGYSNPGTAVAKQLNDPSLLAKAREVYTGVQSGAIADPTNGATMYHADYVSPYWAKSANKNGTVNIGGNIFYKGTGSPQTALSAINQAVPPPLPQARPDTLSAFANETPNPGIRSISVFPNGQTIDAQPPMPRARPDPVMMPPRMAQLDSLLASGHANNTAGLGGSANLFPSGVNPAIYGGQYQTGSALSPDIRAGADLSGSVLPQALSGLTSRSVQTVPIDPMTGNPVTPQQTQRNTLQDALNSYALQQQAAQQGSIKTNGQAGQVAIPTGVVPQSVQRDLSALTIRSGQPMASSVLPKPSVAPSPSVLGGLNYAQGATHPYVPGPSGVVSSYKEPSQLQASAPLKYTTKTVMVPKQVPYITSTPPSSAILGGLGMTGGVLPKPAAPSFKTVMVPQTVRVPLPPTAIPLAAVRPPVAAPIPPAPVSAPGVSYLQAQGQNTAGLTLGQVANDLKASIGSHQKGSFGV